MEYDLPNYVARTVLLPSQSVTSNTNTNTIDLAGYQGKIMVNLDPGTNTAGTSPTVTVNLFDSADNTNFATCNVNSSALTGPSSATVLVVDTRSTRRYLKGVAVIGGTNSPAIPLGVSVIGQKRYQPS